MPSSLSKALTHPPALTSPPGVNSAGGLPPAQDFLQSWQHLHTSDSSGRPERIRFSDNVAAQRMVIGYAHGGQQLSGSGSSSGSGSGPSVASVSNSTTMPSILYPAVSRHLNVISLAPS
jgi:hypothetical protein